jgi:hypothetical protein
MKSPQTLKFLLIFFAGLSFTACDEDPVSTRPVQAQFELQAFSIVENEGPQEISIVLNKTASLEGTITIDVTTENTLAFTTIPAAVDGKIELPVLKGQEFAKFSVVPTDNLSLNADQSATFTLTSISNGFTIGIEKALTLTFVDNETIAQVGFSGESSSTAENSQPIPIAITLSHASPGTGSIDVTIESENAIYGIHYTTEPAAIDGKITLSIEPGFETVAFNVISANDQLFNGNKEITYTITAAEGSVQVGQVPAHVLKITDDELSGMRKGYTISAGSWGYKKEYQYNELGQVSTIYWERNTPGKLSGTYTYEYDAAGNVIRMRENDFTETTYSWENGRIIKEESWKDGLLKKYTLYAYDQAGNVGEAAVHYRQANGELKLSLLFVYLYRQDGNIYKQLSYAPIEGTDDYNLLSTKTFDGYLTQANPFTMVEILPNQNTQPNLPLSYRVEENGFDIVYQFSYEFDDAGKPTKRTASSSAGSEVVSYEYY